MSRDMLRDAAHALRDEGSGLSSASDATRMRIVGSVRAARRRRALAVRGAVLLIAAALGSTAWAAATGRLPALVGWTGLLRSDPGVDVPAPAAPERRERPDVARGATAAVTAGEAAGTAGPQTVPPGPQAVPAGAQTATAREQAVKAGGTPGASAPSKGGVPAATSPVANRASAAAADTASPVVSAPAVAGTSAAADPSDALYERAHALHFQSHDFGAARAAWEAYLKAAPSGRYAVLAHYNRALCLVRLGRRDEARRALQPFASGAMGGYRRAEAQSLIDALGEGPL